MVEEVDSFPKRVESLNEKLEDMERKDGSMLRTRDGYYNLPRECYIDIYEKRMKGIFNKSEKECRSESGVAEYRTVEEDESVCIKVYDEEVLDEMREFANLWEEEFGNNKARLEKWY